MAAETPQAASKPVLLLGERADHELTQMLADGFWQPQVVSAPKPAGKAPPGAQPRVGLVFLRRVRPADIENLRRVVVVYGTVDWIAIVTPHSAAQEPVREFIARHCLSYQTEPLDKERLLYALGHAAGMRNLLSTARGEVRLAEGHFVILGESPAMRQLRHDLLKIAAVDAAVLLTGESGCGKELAAQTIHEQSRRGTNPFIAVNCAALSPSLIHAELFGAEKGAFTGAHARRVGQLEAANRGTVFLDEIGDLHQELQGLLLRFLEEKSVRRLGGVGQIPVDVRVIAATNVDLEAAVRQGRFREDLYYRLNVLRVRIPPLRERREDIEPMAQAFLARFAAEHGRAVEGFGRSALAAMGAHDWPGNTRELLNRIRRAVILGEGRIITAADLQLAATVGVAAPPTLQHAREAADREAVLRGLSSTAGNAREAAKLLGVSRATFYRLIDRHGLAATIVDRKGAQ